MRFLAGLAVLVTCAYAQPFPACTDDNESYLMVKVRMSSSELVYAPLKVSFVFSSAYPDPGATPQGTDTVDDLWCIHTGPVSKSSQVLRYVWAARSLC